MLGARRIVDREAAAKRVQAGLGAGKFLPRHGQRVDRTLARQLVRVLKRFLETGSVAPKKRTRASGMRTRSTLGRPRTSPEPS